MDFTREPIIESIITPKEGYKLVIRSSKGAGQEEYFTDAVEIVSFGSALFFRSLEKPKAFLVPVTDYEVLEVREARMVLKNITPDRSIKIGGGREAAVKVPKEEKVEAVVTQELEVATEVEASATPPVEGRSEKKRERRRHYRKRRGQREEETTPEAILPQLEGEQVPIPPPEEILESSTPASALLSSLLQPPPTLISETIKRYREDDVFKKAFFLTEKEHYTPHDKVQELLNEEDEEKFILQEPTYESPQEESTVDEQASHPTVENVEMVENEEDEITLPLYAEEEGLFSVSEEEPFVSSEDKSEEEVEQKKPSGNTQEHFSTEDLPF